jgi:hypothetical protein
MGRRRKNDEFEGAELIVKLGGLLILLLFLGVGPKNFSAVLNGVVALFIYGAVLVGIVVLGILIIKIWMRSRNDDDVNNSNQAESPDHAANPFIPRIEASEPEIYTTAKLIEKLRTIDWFQFEKLVALAYERYGFTVSRRGGANPDGGIDLIVEKDGYQAAIQCKQWKTWNVGVKAVREFLGALTDAQIQHGIFITLNGYSGDAKQLAEKHGILIINETGLAEMLEAVNFQDDPQVLEILRDTRKFCPKCEREMVLRTAGKGLNAGNQFWGCSGYPKCRFTMPTS